MNYTLKEIFKLINCKPHSNFNYSKFAELTGVSISYISKLVNAQPVAANENRGSFLKLKTFIKNNYGYNLVIANYIDYNNNKVARDNKKLINQIKSLELKIKFLEEELKTFQEIERLIERYEKNKPRKTKKQNSSTV